MPGITRKSAEIFKMCFCDVKILIVSGALIRVIFQNSVTNADCVQTLESLDCFLPFQPVIVSLEWLRHYVLNCVQKLNR